jgi:hypothetical protein
VAKVGRRSADDKDMSVTTDGLIDLAPCMAGTKCPLRGPRRKTYRTLADCPACALAHMDAEAADAAARLDVMGELTGDAEARGAEVRRRLAITADELADMAGSVERARRALELPA